MSAGGAVQAELAQALATIMELTGVFDGPPARAAFPYAAIDASLETDWSHKSGSGREVMIAVTVWDDQPHHLAPTWSNLPIIENRISRATYWPLCLRNDAFWQQQRVYGCCAENGPLIRQQCSSVLNAFERGLFYAQARHCTGARFDGIGYAGTGPRP